MPTTTIYSIHPAIAYSQSVVAGMKKKTGRSLEEWIEHVNENGPAGTEERRAWLKSAHGLGTNYAWWIAERAEGRSADLVDGDAYLESAPVYVDEMYSGKREHLRAVHDALIRVAMELGDEVRICPCQTIVPLFRKHVFAQIKPATNSRIDLGFAFGDMPASGALIDTGGFAKKDRITHRIPISTLDDINDEVKDWLRKAYDRDV
jgi:hypothetical protein